MSDDLPFYKVPFLKAQRRMLNEVGEIRDMPLEFANTIANIYHKFELYIYLNENYDEFKAIDAFVGEKKDSFNLFKDFIREMSKILAHLPELPGFIDDLRELRIEAGENEFQYAVNVLLDSLKYNIKNVLNKRREEDPKFRTVC